MDLQKKDIKMTKLKIDFMNSEGDQSKVATMSKQLVANGNDLVVGIREHQLLKALARCHKKT